MTHDREEIAKRIEQLEKKYSVMGQDILCYLDGLLQSKPLSYWDYIQLETLLSLQKPRTDLPDELIFISYHQICELMFQLILDECKALCDHADADLPVWQKHLSRMIRYWRHLVSSFDIMTEGMDKEQFIQFRMALLPSSGFQSAQYREIEIYSTALHRLVHSDRREQFPQQNSLGDLYQHLYWKSSNIQLKTGKKTLTLLEFERKYDAKLFGLAQAVEHKNIYAKYLALPDSLRHHEALIKLLRTYDQTVNLFWPMAHMGAANRFLQKDPEDLIATGGTNWQEYLPPKHQKILFFPEVWGEGEQTKWGTTPA